jgi:hypothetical protein
LCIETRSSKCGVADLNTERLELIIRHQNDISKALQYETAAGVKGSKHPASFVSFFNIVVCCLVATRVPIAEIEIKLRWCWWLAIESAKHYNYEDSRQDAILFSILQHWQMGTSSRALKDANTGKYVRTSPIIFSDGDSWAELPFLTQALSSY